MAPRWVRERMLHTVYVCKGVDGRVLYVGCTMYDAEFRLAEHRRKPWWPEVTSVETELLPGRSRGLARERELIRQYQPAHNVRSTERATAHRRARKARSDADA